MNFEKYYKDIAKLHIVSETTTEMRGHCPFHSDGEPSFSANKETGLWKCFGTCLEGGNIWQFHAKMFGGEGMTIAKAKKDIRIKLREYKVLPLSLVLDAQESLKTNESLFRKFLLEERHLPCSIIEQFQLGAKEQRIWIPIFDEDGYLINIRKYKPHVDKYKVISHSIKVKGKPDDNYGKAALFPIQHLKCDEIYLMEGEMDCLLAISLGLKAMTITSGASAAPEELLEKFKNKIINICYDIDEAGKKGAVNVASKLQKLARVRIINLPITEPKNGDFTDYIITHKHTVDDFKQLVDNTSFLEFAPTSIIETKDDAQVYEVDLHESAQQNFYYKKVKMKVIISGKDLAPYFAPQMVSLACQQGYPKCKKCPLNLNNGKMHVEYKLNSNEILELIRCSTDKQKLLIRKKVDLPNCNNFEMSFDNILNVEEIRVIPEINYSAKDIEYVTRNLYFVGYGIKTNRSYELEGIMVPDPNNQYVTQLVTKATPTQSSVDQFVMTPEIYERLSVFQCKDISLHSRINEINKDLTYNITKIYGREDLITAVDLIYHSVLQFRFQNQLVQKGWADGLIIGDTRCGKTESLIQLIRHYRMGELCTGENISYAGLVGGMSQAQQRWSISWGKIPLNDRRLIVLDEVSSLNVDTISNLSALRSSGIAEIIKIQTERTNARTRLIWVSNPRSGRKLDTYNYGILAIKELIGRVEDVARFDFAITISADDVPMEIINSMHTQQVPHKYTSDICSQLILWAWSRKPEQIQFSKEAEELILKYALVLGADYSSAIPLVEGAEQRIKIAKLAVSIAARTFSTIDGETILVDTPHVEFVYNFLEKLYTNKSMGYDIFSLSHKNATKYDKETTERLTNEFKEFTSNKTLRDLLLEFHSFRKSEVIDQMGYDQEESKRLFKWMTACKFIKSTPIGYVKQPIFTAFLKNMNLTEEDNKNEFGI